MATRRRRTAAERTYDVDTFQQFICDPELGLAIEALKRANDIFDIIEPQETQHSEILQWLLNPREGHGQGDAIFKDFLTAAWEACLVADGENADFFAHWTPARIQMTGFHSVLLFREYRISQESSLDFFVVDPVNRFLVVIENKYKARHGNEQLNRYRRAAKTLMGRLSHFESYNVAFIALDKGRSRSKVGSLRELKKHWVYLNYSWLKAGASRAEAQLRRGNQSASLLISYCQRQSDYAPEAEKEVDHILSRLAHRYRDLLEPLAEAAKLPLSQAHGLELGDAESDIWLFSHHHPELVTRLTRKKNLSFVEAELTAHLRGARLEFEYGENWVNIFDEDWYSFMRPEDGDDDVPLWPFFLRAAVPLRLRKGPEEAPAYAVTIVYLEAEVRKEMAARIHAAMLVVFPELAGGPQSAGRRRLLAVETTEEDLILELAARYHKLSAVVRNT